MACRPAVELGSTIHSAFYNSHGHSFWAVPMMAAFTSVYFNSIRPIMDLWEDESAMMTVRGELVHESVPPQKSVYLRSKTRHYRWDRGQLWMDLGGRWVIVPSPTCRALRHRPVSASKHWPFGTRSDIQRSTRETLFGHECLPQSGSVFTRAQHVTECEPHLTTSTMT